jgi:hypothetical protein
LCLSAIHYCDKLSETNNLKGRRAYFDSWFQKFLPVVSLHDYFQLKVRQTIMVGVHGGAKVLILLQPGNKERVESKGWGPNISFKGMPPVI